MVEQLDEFIDDFRLESHDSLDQIEQHVLEMEKGDKEAVNIVFRAMHSLKGGSSFLDLINVNRLSHQLENLLDLVRQDKVKPTIDLSDILLRGTDMLKEMIDSPDCGESVDISAMLEEAAHFLEHGSAIDASTPEESIENTTEECVSEPESGDSPTSIVEDNVNNEPCSNIYAEIEKDEKGPFGQFLINKNYLSRDQVFAALIEQCRREKPDLEAFAEQGIDVGDCLHIANVARIHMAHPLKVACDLGFLDDQKMAEVNRQIQGSRPPIGQILRELEYCDQVEARIWLQEYYDYCNDVESDPALQEQLREHQLEKELRQQQEQEMPCSDCQDQSQVVDNDAVDNVENKTERILPDELSGSIIDCDANLIIDFQEYASDELRTQIENIIVDFEEDHESPEQQLKILFRIMHSLKGSVGFINATASQFIIHNIEECINIIQRSPSGISNAVWEQIVSVILTGVDLVWGLREAVINRNDEREYVTDHQEELINFIERIDALKDSLVHVVQTAVNKEDINDLF